MWRHVFRWTGLAAIALILLACAWLVIGLLRPLEPIPRFGIDPHRVAITPVSIIDVAAGEVLADRTILIENGRVASIGPASEVEIPADAYRVDGQGRFLIPGLWDSHVHTLAHSPRLHFPLLLANGVTSIRNMGDGCSWRGDPDCVPDRIEWRAQGAAAMRLVPNTAVTASFHFEEVDDAAEGARLVGILQDRGDTLIKLQLPDDVDPAIMRAIIAEARRFGLPVAGHVPTSIDLRETGFEELASIEHGNQLLDQCQRQAESSEAKDVLGACVPYLQGLASRRTAYVPTFVASTSQDHLLGSRPAVEDAQLRYAPGPVAVIWAAYRRLHASGMDASDRGKAEQRHRTAMDLTLLAHRSGVPVLVGTDALDPFVSHGASLHDELEIFVQAGFSAADSLRAATIHPATVHGQAAQRGQIVVGARADLVLLNANPLERIAATRGIDAVFKGPTYFDKAELERMTTYAANQASDHALNARLWQALLGLK